MVEGHITAPGGASVMVATLVRTLRAVGFVTEDAQRLPTHIELPVSREDAFGARPRYLIALTDAPAVPADQVPAIQRAAAALGASPVLVGRDGTEGQFAFESFLDLLGGPVPSWRALTPEYDRALLIASRDRVPEGFAGQGWRVFEDLVAEGLGFVLGRRVAQLGARARFRAVPDALGSLPDRSVIVVDSKASATAFDASLPQLRPLGEYVGTQIERQRGTNEVFAALVVAPEFHQDDAQLGEISARFYGQYRKPVCFMTADDLATAVRLASKYVELRLAVRWAQILRPGRFRASELEAEFDQASRERRA